MTEFSAEVCCSNLRTHRPGPTPMSVLDKKICSLNAWCELFGEDLRGRCPRTRVGLLTNPQGKGTDSWSMWTPSSPHFTLWSTTSASLIRQRRSQVRKHPCVQAR